MAQKKKKLFFSKHKKNKNKKTYRPGKNKSSFQKNLELFGTVVLLALALVVFKNALSMNRNSVGKQNSFQTEEAEGSGILPAEEGACGRPEIIQDYIVENPYSRSGIPLKKVKGIVVHYVSNPKSTARENRDYFENLKDTHTTKASSHYIIGLDGEIIQCIPLTEISYASNDRNSDTISIECCHEKANGKFNKKTYASLVQLTAWLCDTYELDSNDVIRHYDVTGKMCPLYFVKHEDAWEEFLIKVQNKLDNKGKEDEK